MAPQGAILLFMTQNHTEEIERHYSRWIHDTAINIFNIVSEQTGLPKAPTLGSQIRPIPVYEDEASSLLKCVGARRPTEILWPAVPDDKYVPAYFKRYGEKKDSRNEVVVIAENYCHARFFAAKELMHCLMDDDGFVATNTAALANQLIDELSAGNANLDIKPQTMVDQIAYVGALVYLIPNDWIPLLKQMVADLEKAGPGMTEHAYRHVATMIRVPELLLRIRLTQ